MPEHYGFYAEHHHLGDGGYPGDALIDAANEAIDLRAENERLRGALGAILAGLTGALGDPMGARPSQVTTLYSVASHAMRPFQSGSSPAEPECSLCVQYAKTGGPSHNPSPFCESGKRPHCTCDRCW